MAEIEELNAMGWAVVAAHGVDGLFGCDLRS